MEYVVLGEYEHVIERKEHGSIFLPGGTKNDPVFLLHIEAAAMFTSALRCSPKLVRLSAVNPARTILTCTNHSAMGSLQHRKESHLYVQRRTFLGPLMRYATQFLASLGGTSIRAFFQAFQQAAGRTQCRFV